MSNINEEEYNTRRDRFFHKLEELISEFPDVMTRPTIIDACDHNHNPDSPKMISGIVVIVTTRDADDWEQLFWEAPSGQSHFHTIGMVREVLDSM